MAPQLGIGTFRIDQNGMIAGYAMSNGNGKEIWALLNGVFVMPTYPGPISDLHIYPIAAAPAIVDCAAMCAYLKDVPPPVASFTVREHTITQCVCPP